MLKNVIFAILFMNAKLRVNNQISPKTISLSDLGWPEKDNNIFDTILSPSYFQKRILLIMNTL